jgi:hypothetical protein
MTCKEHAVSLFLGVEACSGRVLSEGVDGACGTAKGALDAGVVYSSGRGFPYSRSAPSCNDGNEDETTIGSGTGTGTWRARFTSDCGAKAPLTNLGLLFAGGEEENEDLLLEDLFRMGEGEIVLAFMHLSVPKERLA